jgi:hypothetical protein
MARNHRLPLPRRRRHPDHHRPPRQGPKGLMGRADANPPLPILIFLRGFAASRLRVSHSTDSSEESSHAKARRREVLKKQESLEFTEKTSRISHEKPILPRLPLPLRLRAFARDTLPRLRLSRAKPRSVFQNGEVPNFLGNGKLAITRSLNSAARRRFLQKFPPRWRL